MLTLIGVSGYRVFDAPTEVPMSRVTVIFGKNNSGKTTLARLPLFVAASLASDDLFSLSFNGMRFGSSVLDVAARKNPHPTIDYWVHTQTGDEWRTSLQVVWSALSAEVRVLGVEANGVKVSQDVSEVSDLRASLAAVGSESIDSVRRRVSQEIGRCLHIGSARINANTVYEARPPEAYSVLEVPYLLNSRPDLLQAVSEWFSLWLDSVEVGIERNDYSFRVTTGSDIGSVNFAAAGRGMQALLPVVVLLKSIIMGHVDPGLVIVEEPEAHLHPSAHAALAELIGEVSTHAQVVVESHSENLVLRLRRMVATGRLQAEDLSLVYLDDAAQLVPIEVGADGSVRNWPEGVFAYDVEEARAIVLARLTGLGQ